MHKKEAIDRLADDYDDKQIRIRTQIMGWGSAAQATKWTIEQMSEQTKIDERLSESLLAANDLYVN